MKARGAAVRIPRRLIALAKALLARLGLLRRSTGRPDARPAPQPRRPVLAGEPTPVFSLGLPGDWTPMTGSEP
jgi:hypothetical protein